MERNDNIKRILEVFDEYGDANKLNELKNIKSSLYNKLYRKLRLTKKEIYWCLVKYQPFVLTDKNEICKYLFTTQLVFLYAIVVILYLFYTRILIYTFYSSEI